MTIKFSQQQEEIRQRFIKRKEILILIGNKEEFVELQERLIAGGLRRAGSDKSPLNYDKYIIKHGFPPLFLVIGSGCTGYGYGYMIKEMKQRCESEGKDFEFVHYKDVKDTLDELISIIRPKAIQITTNNFSLQNNLIKEPVIFHNDHISIGKVKIELEDVREIYLRAFGLKDVSEETISRDESPPEEDIKESSALLYMEI